MNRRGVQKNRKKERVQFHPGDDRGVLVGILRTNDAWCPDT
ncbi:hypothetical protein [Paenibacillus sp. PvR148]